MDFSFLEEIGLTRGEKVVYLALLELGATTAGPLIKKSLLQRSAVYFCLDSLIEKGLVAFVLKNNTKHFEATSPERLLDVVTRKEQLLKKQRSQLTEMIPLLHAKIKPPEKRSAAKLFEGWNGMKSAFDELLREKVNEDYLIYNVCVDEEIFSRLRRFMTKFHQDRVQKKISAKMIIGEELKMTLGADRSSQKLTAVKYFPKGFSTPTAINVYGNKVLLAIWTKEPSAVLIENVHAAKSFKEYFRVMWASAVKD